MNGFDFILLFFDRIYRIYWILSISSLRAIGHMDRWPEIEEYKKNILIILSDLT
jgi:hypothetical protein